MAWNCISVITGYNHKVNGKIEGGHSPKDKVLVMECDEKVGHCVWLLPYVLRVD